MIHGKERKLSGYDLIETGFFVNCIVEPLWGLKQGHINGKRLIID